MRSTRSSLILACFLLALPGALQPQEILDAVRKRDSATVEALARKDPSLLRVKDPEGNSVLHLAALNGFLPLTGLLISLGADIDAPNAQLETPLHAVINNGQDAVARVLIERGADLSRKDVTGNTPLHAAVEKERKDIVQALIAKGAAIESRNENLHTPFMLAARDTGNVEIGRILLRHGADINTKDGYAYTPLNWAAFFGNGAFVDLLLDNGADFDTTEGKGLMILRNAAQYGFPRLFKAVADRDKELFADEKQNTITMYTAIGGGSVEIVKMLLARNIPVQHLSNAHGWRPIHSVARRGHLAMIEFLAGHGADLKARTPAGKSAYSIAQDAGQSDAAALILKLGGDPGPQMFPGLKGPYLGQDPPGKDPKVFAPDIVLPHHSSVTIAPDGREIYWQSPEQTIWTTRLDEELWTKPEALPFSQEVKGRYTDDVPFVSPDGQRMFFTSTRPVEGSAPGKENIWCVDRTPGGWTDPKPLSAAVNSLDLHWQVSVANSGTIYFSGTTPEGYGEMDLYSSRLVNGSYLKPVNLGPAINGKGNEGYPYVAPDESYIIFGQGDAWEFFISSKGPDGQWLKPVKLSPAWRGFCPTVSPDGKYLLYAGVSGVPAVFWVEAGFIEDLRKSEPKGKR